jgi:hypothetical protein
MRIFLKIVLFILSGISALIYMLFNAIGNSHPDHPEQYCNIKINDWGSYEDIPNAMNVCFEELIRQKTGLYFIIFFIFGSWLIFYF